METLWKILGLVLGLICAQLCNGLPINLTTSGPDVQTQYLTGFVAVLLAICSVVLLAGCICCRRNKNGFTEFRDSPVAASVASNLDHGHSNPIANSEFTIFTPISPAHHNNNVFLANQRIVNRTLEDFKYGDIEVSSWFDGSEKDFPRTRLKYIRELGKGWFGRVVEGTAQGLNQDPSEPEWTPVVVRILNASATPKGRVMFLHDVDVYRHGYHPNILRLWGRCLDTTPLLLLQEYCTEGDLKKYLRSMKPTKEKFLSTDLPLLWCYQLTQALKFLHEQKVPHPDLAARNCQLTKDLTLKLGDYGLNSSFYPEDYYDTTLTIPLRWCAPEIISYTNTTIQTKKITLEGNIWSLGVTMWEILECGDHPYSNLNNDEVISQVLGSPNVRLPRPTINVIYTDYMYKLMQSCWSTVESRPSATHIDLILNDLMQVYERTKVSTELNDCSIHDFDQRWELLKPNAVAMTDETPLMQEEKKSASLTNLHGSLDNLLVDHNPMDSWLENVANDTGDLVYAKGLSEAMMDLDNVLELNSNNPSPKPLHFQIGPKVTTSSESETEDENWKKKIERGAYTEKVRQKSRSVADLMVLTHVDYSESDSETLPSLTEFKNQKPKFKNMDNPALKFGSEGNLLSVHDTFQEELRKLQDERRDSLLFVPDKYSYSDSKSGESSSSRQLDSLENSPVKKLLVELNSPAEIIPAKQVYNVFNVSVKHLNNLIDNKDDRVSLQKKTSCDSLKESKDNKDVIHIKNNSFSPEKTGISCDRLNGDEHTTIPSNLDLKPKSLENLSDFHVKIEVLSDQSSPVDEEGVASQEELDRPGSSDDYIKETRKLKVPKLSELIQRNDNLKPDREDKLLLTKFNEKDLIDKDSGLNTPENSASLEKLYDDMEEILNEPSVLKKCSKCAISFEDNEVYTGSFDSDKSNDLKVDLHKDLCLLKEEIKVSSSEGSGCEEDSGTGTSSKETQSIDDNLSAKSLEDTLDTFNNDYCLRRSKIICESFLANEKSNYSPTDEYREICFDTNTKSNDLFKFKEDVTKKVMHQIMSARFIPDLLTDLPDVDKKYSLNKEKKIETLSEYLLKPLIHIENNQNLDSNSDLDMKTSNNLNLTKTSLILPIIKSNSSQNDKESEDSMSSSKSDSAESVAEFLSPEISQASEFKTISECSIESQNNTSQALAIDNSIPNTILDVSSEEMKTLEEGDSAKTLGGDSDADVNVEEFADCQELQCKKEIVNNINLEFSSQGKRRDSLDILRKTKEFLCQELVFYDKEDEIKRNSCAEEIVVDVSDAIHIKENIYFENELSEKDQEIENNSENDKFVSIIEDKAIEDGLNEVQTLVETGIKSSDKELIPVDVEKLTVKPEISKVSPEIEGGKIPDFAIDELLTKDCDIENRIDISTETIHDKENLDLNQVEELKASEELNDLTCEREKVKLKNKDESKNEITMKEITQESDETNSQFLNENNSKDVELNQNTKEDVKKNQILEENQPEPENIELFQSQTENNCTESFVKKTDIQNRLTNNDSINLDVSIDLNDSDIESCDTKIGKIENNDSLTVIHETPLNEQVSDNKSGDNDLIKSLENIKSDENDENVDKHFVSSPILTKNLDIVYESLTECNETYQCDVQNAADLVKDTETIIIENLEFENVTGNLSSDKISTVDVEEIIIEIINKIEDISSVNLKNPNLSSQELNETKVTNQDILETSPENKYEALNKDVNDAKNVSVNVFHINDKLIEPELEDKANFNQTQTILNKTKDFLNNEIQSYIENSREELKVQFDLSDSQEEIAPNSLTHFQGFSSTPYSKKRKPLESTVILGANDDYSIDFYSGLTTTVNEIKAEELKFSSNFMQESPREVNNDLYSLETWDNFLGKSFDEQENDIDFITFNQEPHSLLFLENVNDGFEEKLDKTNNLQVSHVLNETYVPDTKKDNQTFNKDITLNKTYDAKDDKLQNNTFVKNNDTFVKEEIESELSKPSTSTGWESGGGGWFLHPQSNSEELSGQIAVQADSYVGFSMDDEIMAAIRNELLNKLPHAQRASSEQIEEREELEPAEKDEVFIRYNVYNTPLSPIPEESYIDSDDDSPIFTNIRNEEDSDDDSCDWSIEDNISSNIHTEINSPKPESSMISSPAKIPNHRHTPSQDSCCSNDTLFNVEDLNLAIEPDRIFETIPDEDESSKESKYSDCKAEIEEIEDNTLIGDPIGKEQIPKITVHDYITDFLNNERYNQLNSCVELVDLKSENDDCSSPSDNFLTVSDNTLSFGQNVAPLNSPEDRQWKDLQASFRNCDETPEHPKTYLSPIENPEYVTVEEKCTNFELVTDLDDPELDNYECHISDEDIDKVLQEENELILNNTEETSRSIPVLDSLSINLDKETISSSRTKDNETIIYVNTASKLEEGEGSSNGNADSVRSPSDVTEYDGINKNEDSPEYVYVEKHEDNHEYENGWIADTIYANMPADRAKELDYVIAEENKKKAEENIEDLYGPLADIRFSGPGLANLQMMSTSFSESNEVGDEQDWDSGSDTRSSSSGEFIWREGEHEASLKALDAAPQLENPQETTPMEDIQEENELSSSDSDGEGECPEFVPSAWDKYAIPAKSALRSPEKTLERKEPKDKKVVWFKKQKYHCIYEYPKEPDSPILQSYDLWKPTTDYATLADWELGPDLYTPRYDLIDPLSSTSDQQRSPKNLYHLTAFPEKEPTVLDDDFFVSSSSKPFDMLGGTTSQFFPGRQFSDHWIDAATPDCGEDILTPVVRNEMIPTLKHLAGIVVNKNRKSRELGGLRHTRSKLKLDLPPSPSAFSSNTTFNVEQPVEEIVRRQVPTFSTFGKSRFLVQHVDTPPDDKLESKNVSFEALPYKPQNQTVKERQAIESVRGEASLLDSADEDSGIDSSTLERGKKIGT